MARQRKTAGSSRKTTTRKSGASSKKSGVSRKTASSRKKTTTRTTSAGRKKTTTRKSTTSRKTSGGRKTSATRASTSGRKKTASRRSGTTKKTTARRAQSQKTLQFGTLRDVLKEELADLYDAEKQLVDALPKVAAAAAKPELRQALENHLGETRGHVQRLEQIFGQLGMGRPSEHCDGMEGLIQEGDEIVRARGDAAAKDAALIGAAQRVEHYEIAAYGTARTLADELGYDEARDLLNQTLDEESNADSLLTRIATGGVFGTGVNEEAAEPVGIS
jgi:ferritin-like metal-binding protein YciE